MDAQTEQLIVLALIGGAVGFFFVRWWRGRKKSACASGCCSVAPRGPKPTFRREGGASSCASTDHPDGAGNDSGGD